MKVPMITEYLGHVTLMYASWVMHRVKYCFFNLTEGTLVNEFNPSLPLLDPSLCLLEERDKVTKGTWGYGGIMKTFVMLHDGSVESHLNRTVVRTKETESGIHKQVCIGTCSLCVEKLWQGK